MLANITGPLLIAIPYINQTEALVITINTIHLLKSPTLLVCHALYTCGIKVIEVRKDPK